MQTGWQIAPYSEASGRSGVTMTYFKDGINTGELGAWQEGAEWKIDAEGPIKTVIFSVKRDVLTAIGQALKAVELPGLLPDTEQEVRRLLAA